MNASTIQAAVCNKYGAPLAIEDLILADPKEGEVRVRLKAAAICHSDISNLRGKWAGGSTPSVAGHEAAGIVESTGGSVDSVAAGDHVVVTLVRSCGQCEACSAGHTVCCTGTFGLDQDSRLKNPAGQKLSRGFARPHSPRPVSSITVSWSEFQRKYLLSVRHCWVAASLRDFVQ